MVHYIAYISIGYMEVNHDELKCKTLVDSIFESVDTNNSGKVDFTGII
jgi:hypothetical protein